MVGNDATVRAGRDWAMAVHLSVLVGLLDNGIGFVLGPLVVGLLKRDDHEFGREQGLEALNSQLTMFISALAALFLIVTIIGVVIGILLLILTGIFAVVYPKIAASQPKQDVHDRYPFSIRLIR